MENYTLNIYECGVLPPKKPKRTRPCYFDGGNRAAFIERIKRQAPYAARKPVTIWQDEKEIGTFPSITEAAKMIGCNRLKLYRAIKNGKKVNGFEIKIQTK